MDPTKAPNPNTPARPATSSELAAAGWSARLAAFVTWGLLLEGMTGLYTYTAPFSVTAQVQVLLHSAVGLLIVLPCLVYLWRHFLMWRAQTLTVVSALGYAAATMCLVSLITGVWVLLQAAAGTRCGETLSLIHLISGIGVFVLVLIHVPLAWSRRRKAALRQPALAAGFRQFSLRLFGGALATAAAIAIPAMALDQPSPLRAIPADYTIPEYLQAYEEYAGNPFAPTYARTSEGTLIDPSVLSGSQSCGTTGCHEEILREWEPSAHRFAAMNPPFQRVQKNFTEERDATQTRYCAGCHDPISLFAGAKDIHEQKVEEPGMQEGISCVVCHAISHVDQRGNADYVLTAPTKYLWEGTTGFTKFLSDFLIRAYPRQHLVDYDRGILRTPEFCGACHKQFIPESLNRFGVSPGQNQYDEWRNSHWHTDDDKDLSCIDCHMRLVPNSRDPGRGETAAHRRKPDDGAHRHHGTIGTNVLMPEVMKLPGWERHVALTREWIRGETVIPEIADVWPAGPVAQVAIAAPKQATPGEELTFRVVVQNSKVGHNFSTGPLDFIRAWLHVRVLDADQQVVAEWGLIDPKTRRIHDTPGVEHQPGNSRKEGTMVLEGVPLDESGMPLVRHELWKKAGGKGQRVIFPGYSDSQQYRVVLPADTRGPLTIDVELAFRRYRQEFLDLVVPEMERDSGVLQPTVIQTTKQATVPLGSAR